MGLKLLSGNEHESSSSELNGPGLVEVTKQYKTLKLRRFFSILNINSP